MPGRGIPERSEDMPRKPGTQAREEATLISQTGKNRGNLQRRGAARLQVGLRADVGGVSFWWLFVAPACTDRFFDDVSNDASAFAVGDGLVDQVEDVHG